MQVAYPDTASHNGRRVYMYPHSFITGGGALITLADSTKQFNISDNIGSVRSIITVKGGNRTVKGYDYKPFGDTLNADGESRIGYAAKERDEESRYFAMGARQYDPVTGRFLSPDPFFEKFTEQSPYQYSFNNPISFKDPTGFEPEGEKGGEKIQEDEKQYIMEMVLADIALRRMFDDMRNQMYQDAADCFNRLMKIIADHEAERIKAKANEVGLGITGVTVSVSETGVITISFKYNGINICIIYDRSKVNVSSSDVVKNVVGGLEIQRKSGSLGAAVVNNLSNYNIVTLDFRNSAKDIADIWNINHPNDPQDVLGGLSSWKWKTECMGNTDGNTHSTLPVGTILLASEFLENETIPKYDFESYQSTGLFGSDYFKETTELWMVLAHEMKHGWDSNNCTGLMNFEEREASARGYVWDIWNNINAPREAPVYWHHR